MNKNNIGKFISILRKEKGLTQQELADLLNVTDRAISNYETGRRIPDISLYKPICDVFDITVGELINGERINDDKLVTLSNNAIINMLKKSKKDRNRLSLIIKILILILMVLIYLLINYYKDLYPKIDIYNFSIYNIDDIEKQKLEKVYTYNDRNIFYYGMQKSEICDTKECYELKDSLIHNQTNIDKIKSYFDREVTLANINKHILYDGGTTIYKNNRLSIIFCNTVDNNNDIYIGISDMVERLDNAYCGHPRNKTKKFIRTYKVLSATLVDNEFMNIVLENNIGVKGNAKVHISHNLVVGKTYEFTFFTYDNLSNQVQQFIKLLINSFGVL